MAKVLADILGEDDDEEDEAEPQTLPLPDELAAVLGHLLTKTQLVEQTQHSFCTNCCRPLPPGTTCRCGKGSQEAVAELLDGEVAAKWKQQLLEQQREQQLQAQEEAAPGAGRPGSPGGAPRAGSPAPRASSSVPLRPHRTHRRSAMEGLPVALVFDERMLEHRASMPPYPERPERLAAILHRLQSSGLTERCQLVAAHEAQDHELYAVHSPSLLQAVQHASKAAVSGGPELQGHAAAGQANGDMGSSAGRTAATRGRARSSPSPGGSPEPGAVQGSQGSAQPGQWHTNGGRRSRSSGSPSSSMEDAGHSSSGSDTEDNTPAMIAADSLISPATHRAARLAAGASAQLVRQLMAGQASAGMALIRPPGHQASESVAQNGCYFNNAAVAATAAQAAGAERVLVLDWDVHHGQGTQALFEDDPSVLYVSLHKTEEELDPYTGAVNCVGEGEGEGYTINIPWQDADVGDADYLQALLHVVLPVCYQYQPDIIIVSAGFSAAEGDPIGHCRVTPAGYAHMTHLLKGVAPLALLLEGGYNLDVTAKCVEACVRVLLGERPPTLKENWEASKTGSLGIMNAMQIQSQYWSAVHPWSLNGWMEVIREQQEAAARQQREALARRRLQQEAALAALGVSAGSSSSSGSGSGQGAQGQRALLAALAAEEEGDGYEEEYDDDEEPDVVNGDMQLLQAMVKHTIPVTPAGPRAPRVSEVTSTQGLAGSAASRPPTPGR